MIVIVFVISILFGMGYQILEAVNVQKRVLFGGSITAEPDQQITQEEFLSFIQTEDDPDLGSADAKVTIVVFSDFQCPFCKSAYPTLHELADEYGDRIHIIYRDFPVSYIHPDAERAAQVAECADDQDIFWEVHDRIFQNQDTLSDEKFRLFVYEAGGDLNEFDECYNSKKYEYEVLNDYEDGLRLGVTGTPTFFINGNKVPGVIPLETFKKIIDKGLSGV
jgi:protein-disulfide isomerase